MDHTANLVRELKRIASENPEMRKHLVPIIRQAHSKKAWFFNPNKSNLKRNYLRLQGLFIMMEGQFAELIEFGNARIKGQTKYDRKLLKTATQALVVMWKHIDLAWTIYHQNKQELLEFSKTDFSQKNASYGYDRATRELKIALNEVHTIITYLDQMILVAQAQGMTGLLKKLDAMSTEMYFALNTYNQNKKSITLLMDGW